MLPHSPAPITAGEYFIFGRNYSEITKPEKIIHMCSLNSSGWLKSHLILKSIELCLGAWVRGIMRVIDHFWTLEGWMGGRAGINHLISRESTMDIGRWSGEGGEGGVAGVVGPERLLVAVVRRVTALPTCVQRLASPGEVGQAGVHLGAAGKNWRCGARGVWCGRWL